MECPQIYRLRHEHESKCLLLKMCLWSQNAQWNAYLNENYRHTNQPYKTGLLSISISIPLFLLSSVFLFVAHQPPILLFILKSSSKRKTSVKSVNISLSKHNARNDLRIYFFSLVSVSNSLPFILVCSKFDSFRLHRASFDFWTEQQKSKSKQQQQQQERKRKKCHLKWTMFHSQTKPVPDSQTRRENRIFTPVPQLLLGIYRCFRSYSAPRSHSLPLFSLSFQWIMLLWNLIASHRIIIPTQKSCFLSILLYIEQYWAVSMLCHTRSISKRFDANYEWE